MNQKTEQLLASFVASGMFGAFQELIRERIDEIRSKSNKKATEFETLIQVGDSEGRQEELRELIRTLEIIFKRFANKEK